MRADLKKIGEQKRTDLVGQTERALYLLDVISTITDRGNNAEVRRKKDGTLTEYSNAIVHAFQGFRAPFSGKIVHIFPEQSAAFN